MNFYGLCDHSRQRNFVKETAGTKKSPRNEGAVPGFPSQTSPHHPHFYRREHFFCEDGKSGALISHYYKIYVTLTSPENGAPSEAFPCHFAANLCDIGYYVKTKKARTIDVENTGKQNLYILFQRESLHECLSLALSQTC